MLEMHGSDNPTITAQARERFYKILSGGNVDWQVVVYGGVRHSFTNKDADRAGKEFVRYDARADTRLRTH